MAAAAPLLLVDSDATTLLATDTLLTDYGLATLWTVLAGWGLGLLGTLPRATLHRAIAQPAALGVGLAALALAGAVYWSMGTPGLYGDRLFVVLTPQADVSGAAQIPDVSTRRQAVLSARARDRRGAGDWRRMKPPSKA